MMSHCSGAKRRPRLVVGGLCVLAVWAANSRAEEVTPATPKPPVTPAADKLKGPEHNVGLNEDPAVNDLFNRAKKARARAEANPEAWPECVKYYLDILKKYRNSVYLDRWEGADNSEPAFKNGLYRSARERAMSELATLPPAALAVYRVIAEPAVRSLYQEAHEQFDARKMEEIARDYPLTTWGEGAQAWLAEYAFERGAWKDAAARFVALAEHPVPGLKPTAALARAVLAQIHGGEKEAAAGTLTALQAALKTPENGALKIGAMEGDAALASLKTRVASMSSAAANLTALEGGDAWTTYLGNSAHTQVGQARTKIGLRKWSWKLDELLYGPDNGAKNSGGNGLLINQQLTIQDGILHLTDERASVGYPLNDPRPGTLKEGGDCIYRLPSESVRPPEAPAAQDPNVNPFNQAQMDPSLAMVEHPCFTSLASGRWFGILKNPDAGPQYSGMWGGGRLRIMMGGMANDDSTPKQPLNYLVCMGRANGAKEPSVLWSLKPGEPAFNALPAKEQDWLRTIALVSSPTIEAGVLYVTGVTYEGTAECTAAAIDAESGRVLWMTPVCSGVALQFQGMPLPDRGVPLTVVNDTVYCVSNLGAVAALNAATGDVRWIRVYDRLKATNNPFNGMETVQIRDLWAPNPPLVVENRLLVAPQDADTLYAYDVQTGARVWEHSRRVDSANTDERGLRYVLGVVNGVVALSGADVRLLRVKNGKRIAESIVPESPLVGRGTVTAAGVLASTEKGLLQIDIARDGENFTVSPPRVQEWADGPVEAGHVVSVGGLLYTISHTHINAYFIWEEMEAQLRQRLAQNAGDKRAHIELADIYASIERFDDALAELDAARKNLGDADKATLTGVERRRTEALLAGGAKVMKGRTPDLAAAITNFKAALETVKSAGLPDVFAVRALQALADAYTAMNDLPAAAQALQTMVEQFGLTEYQFEAHNATRARIYAQNRLAALRVKDPAAYAAIEKKAVEDLTAAGNDPKKLAAVSEAFPASESAGKALLLLGRLELEKSPDHTRLDATRFLSRHPNSPDAAESAALLVVANERMGLLAYAKDALRDLAESDNYKEAKFSARNVDPSAAAEPVSARAWALKRLESPEYQKEPSRSALSLATGKLNPLWSKPGAEKIEPLRAQGIAPLDMRRAVLYLDGSAISAVAGLDGEEVWRTHAPLPEEIHAAWWHEGLLLVFGKTSVAAFDSADGGVVWSRELKGALPMTQSPAYFWRANADGLFIVNETVLLALDPNTGQEQWSVRDNRQFFNSAPMVNRRSVICANVRGNKLLCFDAGTGAARWNVLIEPLTAPLAGNDERVYVPLTKGKLKVLSPKDGKPVRPDIEIGVNIGAVREAGELAIIQTQNGGLSAYRWSGDKPGLMWNLAGANGDTIADFTVDGDDVMVLSSGGAEQGSLSCYSLKGEGKLRWKQHASAAGMSRTKRGPRGLVMNNGGQIIIQGQGRVVIQNMVVNGRVVRTVSDGTNATEQPEEPGALLDSRLSRGHVVNLESNWDVSGEGSKIATLIDRATGKAVWDTELHSEDLRFDGTVAAPPEVQLFDGGLVVCETRGRSAFGLFKRDETAEVYEQLKAKVAANPGDLISRRKLTELNFAQGKTREALVDLAAVLSDPALEASQFGALYRRFAELRREAAAQQHAALNFARVAAAPAVDGGEAGWEKIAAQTFDGFADVYQGSEDPASKQDPVKDLWHGAADLSATFKGAYDDKNLYIAIDVKDDVQRNDQSESAYLELGDALTLAFDIGLAGGMGYRGETFELSLGLKKNGTAGGWRRHEHGRYLKGVTPLEKQFSVTRIEAQTLTRYQVALPLEYLGLKAEPGKQFGLTFAVHDQDGGAFAEKHLCSSPGLVGVREPRYFSRGTLGK